MGVTSGVFHRELEDHHLPPLLPSLVPPLVTPLVSPIVIPVRVSDVSGGREDLITNSRRF